MALKNDGLWIFAYGSLCWRPGFENEEMVLGHVKGFVRRFWQGNTVHRGSMDKPGRVATLVPDQQGETWGCAFRVKPSKCRAALKYLENRETKLGAYECKVTVFYPSEGNRQPVQCLLYVAMPGNEHWRGPADSHDIADEVISAVGICGSNLDYVFDLTTFLRSHRFEDAHLFELEVIIKEKLASRKAEEDEELCRNVSVSNNTKNSLPLFEVVTVQS